MNRRGLNMPTTAMIGKGCEMRNVGTSISGSCIGVAELSHFLNKERVASHERKPRDKASATPIAERIARAPSFLLTNSFVE